MINFIIGTAVAAGVGAAAGAAAGTLLSRSITASKMSPQIYAQGRSQQPETLNAENERLRQYNLDAERRIEELTRELQKAKARFNETDDKADDLEDDLNEAKTKIKKLTQQNDQLLHKVQELRMACENYEMEIAELRKERKQ